MTRLKLIYSELDLKQKVGQLLDLPLDSALKKMRQLVRLRRPAANDPIF